MPVLLGVVLVVAVGAATGPDKHPSPRPPRPVPTVTVILPNPDFPDRSAATLIPGPSPSTP